jgi:predicted metallo-beta-lactamase superfamily hydrolase
VQDRAISLAKEHSAALVYLYIADSRSCGVVSQEFARVVEDELRRVGRSLLHIAHVRSQEQGVEAELVARCGPVRQTILDFVTEARAEVLVVGAPRSISGAQEFGEEGIRAFAEEVTRTTGVEVVIV